ncbi:hypothetical protein BROUX41_002164 [Berkeleyomyces rouxiae]|uniref:uncharacterized protein n=1 Tax=Berkeleyomyces rouxiae TaxID=2035830 RepID=UPI003B76983A
MPPKPKAGAKPSKGPDSTTASTDLQAPTTVGQRSLFRFYQTNPTSQKLDEHGLIGLETADLTTWANAKLIREVAAGNVFSNARSERDYWKTVQKDGVPFRSVQKNYDWGADSQGRSVADYSLPELDVRLLALEERLVLGLSMLLLRDMFLERNAD